MIIIPMSMSNERKRSKGPDHDTIHVDTKMLHPVWVLLNKLQGMQSIFSLEFYRSYMVVFVYFLLFML